MQRADLIYYTGGVEMPAPGTWTIHKGQDLALVRRGWLAARSTKLQTIGGRLVIGRGLPAGTLSLELTTIGSSGDVRCSYRGQIEETTRAGIWYASGTTTIDGVSTTHDLVIVYQGVFAHGAQPVAWLRVLGGADGFGQRRSGRKRARLAFVGDLNAVAPRPVAARRLVGQAPLDLS